MSNSPFAPYARFIRTDHTYFHSSVSLLGPGTSRQFFANRSSISARSNLPCRCSALALAMLSGAIFGNAISAASSATPEGCGKEPPSELDRLNGARPPDVHDDLNMLLSRTEDVFRDDLHVRGLRPGQPATARRAQQHVTLGTFALVAVILVFWVSSDTSVTCRRYCNDGVSTHRSMV